MHIVKYMFKMLRCCLFDIFRKPFRAMGNKLNCHGEKNSSRQIITENEISLLLANTEMDREQIIDFHANF